MADIPLSPYPGSGQYTTINDVSATGIPRKKSKISQKDLVVLAIQILCFSMAVTTVFHQQIASSMGQLYQLIVIGFLLAIMASFMEDQSIRAMLVYLGYRRDSALQDFDAMLRKDLFAPQIGMLIRAILFFITVLPLGLAISYKLFVGGSSKVVIDQGDGIFGYSAAPGQQRIGDGLTLLADIYQPFWVDPALNRTYGFNMYIADNDTSIIPDTPYPEYLTLLQSKLGSGEYIMMTAEVNGTISQLKNPTADERASSDWWQDVQDQFGTNWTENGNDINGANNALWAGQAGHDLGIRSNFSVAFLSAWNTTRNETFFSEAYRCEHHRRLCTATWKVTSSSMTLTAVDIPQFNPSAITPNQSIIQNDWLGVQEMFSNFLGEYDWHNRAGDFNFPYPSPDSNDTAAKLSASEQKWTLGVNTVCPLSVAMVWARITSLNGGDRPIRNPEQVQHTMYTKPATEINLTKFKPTLQRSYVLLIILAINPTIVLLCFILKTILFHSPIDDSFNAVSLLASTADSDMSVLKGAGLSGQLNRRLHIGFSTVAVVDEEKDVRYIKAVLDQPGRSERLTRGTKYA